ncbi:MAG TPA: tetratricopeptide repeat protein [Frankiaceae bacterium]|nr:tetratricopeptide repeat protein [Frankiaceae bacterium]
MRFPNAIRTGPARSLLLLLAALVVLGAAPACGKESPRKQAGAEVQKGLAAHVAGDVAKALEHYQNAVEAEPNNAYAIYNIGLIAQNRGDLAEAERRYRAVLAIDPRFTAALFNLAIIRFDAKAYEESVDLYRRVIEITPNDANAHLNLGFALKELGRETQGEAELKKAIKLNPQLASRIPKSSPSPQPPADPSETPTTSP